MVGAVKMGAERGINMIRTKVYLAGPIRGVPDYKERFAETRRFYEQCGCAVLDPSLLPEGMEQADYMRIYIAMLQSADFVQMLPGWEESEGATLEKAHADMVGIAVKLPRRKEG